MIDDSDKITLDDFPIYVRIIVSGFDKASRDRFDVTKFGLPELMYDRTMRRFGYVFELKAGRGKLLVTGFNFTNIKNYAVSAMLKTLINYCKLDDFNPSGKISVEGLKKYLSDVADSGPNKEGMMTQYWQLDSEPVESMEYWTESERYLRDDM